MEYALSRSFAMSSKKIILSPKKILIPIALIAALLLVASLFYLRGRAGKGEEILQPIVREAQMEPMAEIPGTEVGSGWSKNGDPYGAVSEALGMALQGKKEREPDIVFAFASSGSDLKAIQSQLRKMLGDGIMIFGGTSDSRAVCTERGLVAASRRAYEQSLSEERRALALMSVKSKDITFGVGSANFSDYSGVQEASRAAILMALQKAGQSPQQRPRIVLAIPTLGVEEEVIEGIEGVLGKDTPILGGTAGGPTPGVFGARGIYDKGVCVAVIYTDLPLGWAFEGGFEVTDSHSGIITRVSGQAILEIDGRPALDVYNEWLDGKIDRLYKEFQRPDVIRDLLALNPLYRRYTNHSGHSYFLFSHPWPKDDALRDRSIMTSTKIKAGERVYLARGTWEVLLNRIGNLPQKARVNGRIDPQSRTVFGLALICGGVMGVIPEAEREKIPYLINYATHHGPFIANFTWGEQGYFPGIGNRHGNLFTSFLLIAAPK
jgi:hypothetical protein